MIHARVVPDGILAIVLQDLFNRSGRRKKVPVRHIRQQQDKCFHTYGYRRMWQWLKNREGIRRNPKTILRVMKKHGLLAEILRR